MHTRTHAHTHARTLTRKHARLHARTHAITHDYLLFVGYFKAPIPILWRNISSCDHDTDLTNCVLREREVGCGGRTLRVRVRLDKNVRPTRCGGGLRG